MTIERPAEPEGEDCAWYRGWECGWDRMRDFYTSEGYSAYKGGADLDAPNVSADTWAKLLDAVDDEED
jgi:hypothetical protein